MPIKLFKTAHQKVADFCEGRTRQSDDDFILDCDLPNDENAIRVALAVRRAVARVGLVDPLYIRADDRYPEDLGVLPLWDSMDWLALIFAIEDELDLSISDKDAETICIRHFSVRQCALDTRALVQRLRATP